MKEVLDFLNELAENNNRNWFQNNKNRYLKVQNKINDFALQLIQGISEFDDSIKNIGVKDATYRIYRDIRFSHDKRPYKTHIGILYVLAVKIPVCLVTIFMWNRIILIFKP